MNSMNISAGLPSSPRRPPPLAPYVWTGAVMLVSSLFFVFFAGCFLIGVLGMLRPFLFNPNLTNDPRILSSEEQILLWILYGLTFACLLGALILFVLGLRAFLPLFRRAGDLDD
jgi:hypothetical protein